MIKIGDKVRFLPGVLDALNEGRGYIDDEIYIVKYDGHHPNHVVLTCWNLKNGSKINCAIHVDDLYVISNKKKIG